MINNYEIIIDNIDEFYKEYCSNLNNITTFEEGKQSLAGLLSRYKQLLHENTSIKDPFHSLNEAERYSVWEHGRNSFTTVVKSSQFEIIQQEILLLDSELLAEEHEKINDTPPLWFQRLALWQQDFIKTHKATLLKKSIPSSLRSVPGVANLSKHVFSIDGVVSLSYFRHATQRPVDLMNTTEAYDEEYRITCLNMASHIRLSLLEQSQRVDTKPKSEAVILTQSLLSPGAAANLKSKLSGPSDNDTAIYRMKEKIVMLFQYALAYPEESVDKKHCQLKALFFNTSLHQTIYYKDFLAKWGLTVHANGLFEYQNYFWQKITLISTNHPLNMLRRFSVSSKQTTNNDYNTALLFGAVGRFLKPIFEEYSKKNHSSKQFPFFNQVLKILSKCEEEKKVVTSDRQNLLKIIDNLLGDRHKLDENTQFLLFALQMQLSTPLDQGSLTNEDARHNQLMISSAEALILNGIQGSLWAACKSGKDRTGVASAAYDAALLYYKQYKKLPGYTDGESDRKNYISLLEKLFDSGHQQEAAGQNAPGAKGIVLPKMILPIDVQLDEYSSRLNTHLARLNKPSDPGKGINSLKGLGKALFYNPVKKIMATEILKSESRGSSVNSNEKKEDNSYAF